MNNLLRDSLRLPPLDQLDQDRHLSQQGAAITTQETRSARLEFLDELRLRPFDNLAHHADTCSG
jgi:hypothetical protein